jgi:hypothetical protein
MLPAVQLGVSSSPVIAAPTCRLPAQCAGRFSFDENLFVVELHCINKHGAQFTESYTGADPCTERDVIAITIDRAGVELLLPYLQIEGVGMNSRLAFCEIAGIMRLNFFQPNSSSFTHSSSRSI